MVVGGGGVYLTVIITNIYTTMATNTVCTCMMNVTKTMYFPCLFHADNIYAWELLLLFYYYYLKIKHDKNISLIYCVTLLLSLSIF